MVTKMETPVVKLSILLNGCVKLCERCPKITFNYLQLGLQQAWSNFIARTEIEFSERILYTAKNCFRKI